MPQINNPKNKEMMEIKKEISSISVINNSSLKPYLETFKYEPENITQKPLGILVGFFEVREYSEDSAYIVNFLNSVFKKEYYINSNRSASESFDCALHKTNIALSELVKHGNINWLGKLDAAICVIEKNSIHFSVTGSAKILLYRKNVLTEISEELAPENTEIHPLKTFTNVSSGRLEKKDKLIVTSENIFQILPEADIKKGIERFSNEKFSQFIKTALANELDLAATIIIDAVEFKKATKKSADASSEKPPAINVFSEKTFKKNKKGDSPLETIKTIEKNEFFGNKDKNEYTDKKTGHIYVQAENNNQEEAEKFETNLSLAMEIITNAIHDIKKSAINQFSRSSKELKKSLIKISISGFKNVSFFIKYSLEKIKEAQTKKENRHEENKPTVTVAENKKMEISADINSELKSADKKENNVSVIKNFPANVAASASSLAKKINSFKKPENTSIKQNMEKLFSVIFPHISKIRNTFVLLNSKQKKSISLAIILIFLAPFLFFKFSFQQKEPPTQINDSPKELTDFEKLSADKNVTFIEQSEKIATLNSKTIKVFVFENSPLTISENKISIITNNESRDFEWSSELGKATIVSFMKDLNLILILTDKNKIFSFSPISEKFIENSISLPDNSQISQSSTYLTYIYLIDKKAEQIYRYPRAEGGFGEKINWLKDNFDLSNVLDMAINDNVYLLEKDGLTKMFRGKKVDFSLENSNTPLVFNQARLDISSEDIYILDAANSRIVHFDKEGKIIKQYHNEALKNASLFKIDEQNKKAYFITSDNELNAIPLQ